MTVKFHTIGKLGSILLLSCAAISGFAQLPPIASDVGVVRAQNAMEDDFVQPTVARLGPPMAVKEGVAPSGPLQSGQPPVARLGLPTAVKESVAPSGLLQFLLSPVAGLSLPTAEKESDAPSELLYQTPVDSPLGFAGKSRVRPRAEQTDNRFIPIEDRWRVGFPEWDRYGRGHPLLDDYPYIKGRWWDPFNQNVLKADYPIVGQNIFLEVTATTQTLYEPRQNPTGTTPFESTRQAGQFDFFGNPNQNFFQQPVFLSFDLFRGDAAFRPVDWRVKITGAFNFNDLAVRELAVVTPDVTTGLDRARTYTTLQEWFAEAKIADLGPDYDFISMRVGSQPFTSDFRGFIFSDVNRGVRLFGNRNANRDQFNLLYFYQLEKDTNSGLNTFRNRSQQIFVANWYRQDFVFPGYTSQWSVHVNHDAATFRFDNNGFLVRPDPVGVFQPHSIDVAYLGWAGDGHINRLNINHAFYWALGRDGQNPLANAAQTINAQMAALELSIDHDWIRFRTSFFWASGDRNVNNSHATGFDSILDNPNFAGGEFTYWQRQQLRLFGVNLTQRMSLVPDLRSSKNKGQTNFVNPGLYLGNFGFDVEATPRLRFINNANVLWFDSVNPLQQFLYQREIRRFIGTDLSTGMEYRPLLNNNVICKAGLSMLVPGAGFRSLFNRLDEAVAPQLAGFLEVVLTY